MKKLISFALILALILGLGAVPAVASPFTNSISGTKTYSSSNNTFTITVPDSLGAFESLPGEDAVMLLSDESEIMIMCGRMSLTEYPWMSINLDELVKMFVDQLDLDADLNLVFYEYQMDNMRSARRARTVYEEDGDKAEICMIFAEGKTGIYMYLHLAMYPVTEGELQSLAAIPASITESGSSSARASSREGMVRF